MPFMIFKQLQGSSKNIKCLFGIKGRDARVFEFLDSMPLFDDNASRFSNVAGSLLQCAFLLGHSDVTPFGAVPINTLKCNQIVMRSNQQ
jgi:hypothetical protein